ncbi:carboxypeptidase 2 [Pseudomassariella vexata]|uniref:Carboxypeptidase n=1 Tax=Pseudomassariella vexata TaxID=1141098 RepID=A0A1Y2DCX8_9PEZI|nr:carboxypeptidase 2 [Pseudomassariella vexata]ORY56964.1 carboxypeptidase 2 [Pseudomassariella vexata]
MVRPLLNATWGVLLLLFAKITLSSAGSLPRNHEKVPEVKRQVPSEPQGVKTITTPSGATIRYSQPGKEGVCETTSSVDSYSGYVDLDDETHMFFWFFEARNNPNEAPLTLWLNGGPGSDSLIGLFEELGPCQILKNLTSKVNPYAWNEVTNLLFLSQPIGVGFSYADEVVGILDETTGLPVNSSNPDGRYSVVDPDRFDTTELSAIGAWEVLQGFIESLDTLDETVTARTFNLWTESYGGHYGPAFYRYFFEQNEAIQNGSAKGCELNMHTLGIINGIISEKIQAPYYPEFAYRNTYGIEAVNETIYNYMKMNYYFPEGCSDMIDECAESDRSTKEGTTACSSATAICRGLVEGPYYHVSGRSPYDIRAEYGAEIPPGYWQDYLNLPATQNAIGVNLNYSSSGGNSIFDGFTTTGDFVYPDMLEDLEVILDEGVSIHLIYGDADYICNWFGGEAVSLQVNYTHAKEFRAAGYEPFVVDGTEYGESRQYGNFSFTRIYDSGHEVPYYQPKASLELFRRILADLVVSDGTEKVTATYESEGPVNATHTNVAPTPYYTGRPDINEKRDMRFGS